MKSSFWVKTEKLKQLQELVCAYDHRFIGNPIVMGNRARVCIDSDHLPFEKCHAFQRAWNDVNTPIVERRASQKKLRMNKVKRFLGSLRSAWSRYVL